MIATIGKQSDHMCEQKYKQNFTDDDLCVDHLNK